MFEHRRQKLLPRRAFLIRLSRYAAAAFIIVVASWLIGILGYRVFEQMPWIDAVLNAAMILGGMGPVNPLHTDLGKIFASVYALFSGMIFVAAAGLFVAPILHRLLHQFHLEADRAEEKAQEEEDAEDAEDERSSASHKAR